MKKFRIKTLKVIALLLSLMMLNGTPVAAAEVGSIQLQMKSKEIDGVIKGNVVGVEFYLYQIGTVSFTGAPTYFREYDVSQCPETAAELEKLAGELAKREMGEPLQKQKTNENGDVTFEGLSDGIYFLSAVDNNPYGEIMPSIIHVPYYEEMNGQSKGPFHQVEIEPKGEPRDRIDVDPVDPKDPEEPAKPVDPGKDKVPETTAPITSGFGETCETIYKRLGTIQTSDSAKIFMYLNLIAISVITLIVVLIKRKRGGTQSEK